MSGRLTIRSKIFWDPLERSYSDSTWTDYLMLELSWLSCRRLSVMRYPRFLSFPYRSLESPMIRTSIQEKKMIRVVYMHKLHCYIIAICHKHTITCASVIAISTSRTYPTTLLTSLRIKLLNHVATSGTPILSCPCLFSWRFARRASRSGRGRPGPLLLKKWLKHPKGVPLNGGATLSCVRGAVVGAWTDDMLVMLMCLPRAHTWQHHMLSCCSHVMLITVHLSKYLSNRPTRSLSQILRFASNVFAWFP